MSKRKGLLLIGLVLMVAVGGVVYAHWQQTLKANATVSTGSINVMWQSYGTDDDGVVGNDLSANDNNSDVPPGTYDAWLGASSDDPAEMWRCTGTSCGYTLNGAGLTRYDKDVAKCEVGLAPGDPTSLTATITDAYPSYHCTVFSQLSNEGNVPVKMTAFRLTAPGTVMYVGTEYVAAAAGNTAWCNDPAHAGRCPLGVWAGGIPVLTFDFADGTSCGNQLDPFTASGDNDTQAVWFHVEQGDDPATPGIIDNLTMDQDYSFSWQMDFVNWNEWNASMCTISINGVQVYP